MSHHYDGDASTLVDEDRRRRQRRPQTRHRSPSVDTRRTRQSYYDEEPRDQKQGHSKYETIGQAVLVLGVIQLIGGIYHIIREEKAKKEEREYRRQKRRAFERAKEKRRLEEERRERDDDSDDEYDRRREVRRITYGPATSHSRSSSHSRSERRLDQPPSRSRGRSRRDSVAGSRYERDSRAASRMR